jgi:hypothetical protein
MNVFTVTVIDIIGDPVLGNRRTPAIYTDMESAILALKNNESDMSDDGFYQYAVIEETSLNVVYPFVDSGKQKWFRYNSVLNEFEPCEPSNVPNKISRLHGFGIG